MAKAHFKRYLVTGLLIWVPLGVTIFALRLLVGLMDRTLLLLPAHLRPDALLGFHVPGLGLVLAVVVLLLTGVLTANLLGRRLVGFWEALLGRIPLVRSIYKGAKQVAETVFSESGQAFRKVVLIPYPNDRTWALAFVTSTRLGEVQEKTGREVVSVFLPTTPNPTSGFILLVPKEDIVELEMTVDEAIRMIISLGVVVPVWPGGQDSRTTPPLARPGPTP
ncbi:MAG: DUF502 domain-containing protein [Gammaproteobacteria bacterium]|jgi:uncharacterized membrane protein